jgi:hypothetical protein
LQDALKSNSNQLACLAFFLEYKGGRSVGITLSSFADSPSLRDSHSFAAPLVAAAHGTI